MLKVTSQRAEAGVYAWESDCWAVETTSHTRWPGSGLPLPFSAPCPAAEGGAGSGIGGWGVRVFLWELRTWVLLELSSLPASPSGQGLQSQLQTLHWVREGFLEKGGISGEQE